MSKPKTDNELQLMRESGRMLATILDLMESSTTPGITAKELADLAAKELKAMGGSPAFLGVDGGPGVKQFPDVICISVNEEVQHGIPGNRVINDGDVVNFDFGVNYKGMITDSGRTIAVGKISLDAQRLLTGTKKALYAGLKQVKDGASVYSISGAIEDVLRENKLGIVLELVGHGVGHELHEPPEIPNYRVQGSRYILRENQTVAIEPIATLGSGRIEIAPDQWTILSADNTLSAQFEHTIRVTKDGYEILTTL